MPSDAVGQSASAARTPSSDIAGWTTFTSTKWGYSLSYPQTWLDLPNFGADTEKYFSNENVESPSSLDANGVFLAVSVNSATGAHCFQHGFANAAIERHDPLIVDGIDANLVVANSEGYWELILNVQREAYCYWFVFVFKAEAIRDADEPIAQQLLGQTFHFGTPRSAPEPA